jgi:hypothetical protein
MTTIKYQLRYVRRLQSSRERVYLQAEKSCAVEDSVEFLPKLLRPMQQPKEGPDKETRSKEPYRNKHSSHDVSLGERFGR